MKKVGLISVPVTDQQKAKDFYLRMGLTLVAENNFEKQKWIQLSFPEAGGPDITLVNWFPDMPAGYLRGFTILTDDITTDIATLQHNGIATGKIDETPWGKFVSITDPDGNKWTLHQRTR